jgi:hypothetical protein
MGEKNDTSIIQTLSTSQSSETHIVRRTNESATPNILVESEKTTKDIFKHSKN